MATVGHVVKASELIGIPENTIRYWMKQDWWEEEMRRQDQADTGELKATYTRIAKRAAMELEERLENGDTVVTSNGAIARKPISGKELAIITAVAADKRKQSLDIPVAASVQSSAERLATLMDNFIKFASAKQIEGESKEIKDAE